jgi:hypothetical protein
MGVGKLVLYWKILMNKRNILFRYANRVQRVLPVLRAGASARAIRVGAGGVARSGRVVGAVHVTDGVGWGPWGSRRSISFLIGEGSAHARSLSEAALPQRPSGEVFLLGLHCMGWWCFVLDSIRPSSLNQTADRPENVRVGAPCTVASPCPCRLILHSARGQVTRRRHRPEVATAPARMHCNATTTVRDGGERWPYENGDPTERAGTKRSARSLSLSCARENIERASPPQSLTPPTPAGKPGPRTPTSPNQGMECHAKRTRTELNPPTRHGRKGATNSIGPSGGRPRRAAPVCRIQRTRTGVGTGHHPRASPSHRDTHHPRALLGLASRRWDGRAGDRRTGRLGMFSPSAGQAPLILTTPLSGGRLASSFCSRIAFRSFLCAVRRQHGRGRGSCCRCRRCLCCDRRQSDPACPRPPSWLLILVDF